MDAGIIKLTNAELDTIVSYGLRGYLTIPRRIDMPGLWATMLGVEHIRDRLSAPGVRVELRRPWRPSRRSTITIAAADLASSHGPPRADQDGRRLDVRLHGHDNVKWRSSQ